MKLSYSLVGKPFERRLGEHCIFRLCLVPHCPKKRKGPFTERRKGSHITLSPEAVGSNTEDGNTELQWQLWTLQPFPLFLLSPSPCSGVSSSTCIKCGQSPSRRHKCSNVLEDQWEGWGEENSFCVMWFSRPGQAQHNLLMCPAVHVS